MSTAECNDESHGDHGSSFLRNQIRKIAYAETASVAPIPYSKGVSAGSVDDSVLKHKKVTIVGCGQVGMAIAYAILNQEIAGCIALVDMNEEKLDGEARDLQHGAAFHQNCRILSSTSYEVSAHSHLVIVTAGVAQKVGESRLNLVQRNVGIMKSIVPKIIEYSPDAAICIVANPCDVMTAVAAKIAGPSIPAGRIFGSGTCLDSSRLRSLIAQSIDADTSAVTGFVFGEHGDSSVPIWSSVHVGGLPMPAKDPELLELIHREVVTSAGNVIRKKGYTNWAVGLTGAYIAKAVLNDTREVMAVSTCVRGLYGIESDVFLSVACFINCNGISQVLAIPLEDEERKAFQKSADAVWDVQKGVWDSI